MTFNKYIEKRIDTLSHIQEVFRKKLTHDKHLSLRRINNNNNKRKNRYN